MRDLPQEVQRDAGAASEIALITQVLTLLLNVTSSGWHRKVTKPPEVTAEVNKHLLLQRQQPSVVFKVTHL